MSIASEVERISANVQNTIDTIKQTGVAVPEGANSDNLPALAQDLANEKQDKLTGTQGQVVGFDSSGNAIAQEAPSGPAEDVSYDNETSGMTATNVQGALDELAQGLKGGTITSVTATATAAGWSGDIPVQTINVAGMTATSIAWVGLPETATAQQRDAARKAVMSPTAQGAGTITLTCDGAKPAIDIPIIVYLSGGAE